MNVCIVDVLLCPQTVYDEWFITLYNLVYTALPVLGMSLFDQVTCSFTCRISRISIHIIVVFKY